MATAKGYIPFGKKVINNMAKHPDEILRCKRADNGKYVLIKKYVYKTRRPFKLEMEDCKLDHPAEYIHEPSTPSYAHKNDNYEIELINYYVDKGNCNEYELRNLIMVYLKKKRKVVNDDIFKSACNIFDKADKMLSRCDRRKNSNTHEANTSYRFLIKSYKKIVDMIEMPDIIASSGRAMRNNDKEALAETQERLKKNMASHMGMGRSSSAARNAPHQTGKTATQQAQQSYQDSMNKWASILHTMNSAQYSKVKAQYIKYSKIV